MTDETTIYVRPSTVTSHALCPARTGLIRKEGHYPNEALLFGSLVHWMIEQTLRGNQFSSAGALLELSVMFVKDIPDSVDTVDFKSVTSQDQRQLMVYEADEAWKAWRSKVQPLLPDEVPFIEETLAMSVHYGKNQPHEIVLRGTPDAVYPEAGLMIDWKTAGRAWAKDKAEGQLQRIAYPMMAAADKDWQIDTFIFWVYDRAKKVWDKYETASGPHRAEAAFLFNTLQVAFNQMNEHTTYTPSGGGFKARGWHCSPQYCDAWGICDGKYLVADGQADQPALTLKERWA